eukprot:9834188-Alexandrium_andersonii.AAC.1
MCLLLLLCTRASARLLGLRMLPSRARVRTCAYVSTSAGAHVLVPHCIAHAGPSAVVRALACMCVHTTDAVVAVAAVVVLVIAFGDVLVDVAFTLFAVAGAVAVDVPSVVA